MLYSARLILTEASLWLDLTVDTDHILVIEEGRILNVRPEKYGREAFKSKDQRQMKKK